MIGRYVTVNDWATSPSRGRVVHVDHTGLIWVEHKDGSIEKWNTEQVIFEQPWADS